MVAVQELLDKLDGLTARVKQGMGRDAAAKAVEDLRKMSAPEWLVQGTVQAQFAKLYGEIGSFDDAMAFFQEAVESDDRDAPATLQTVELWANQEARSAEQARHLDIETRRNKMRRAIARLDHLVAIGKTTERLGILGSAYKRWAQMESDPKEVLKHLNTSAKYYSEAAQLEQDRTLFDPYPTINWLAIRAVLGQQDPTDEMWLGKCEEVATQRCAGRTRDLWGAVMIPDVALLRSLREGTTETMKDALVALYRQAIAEGGATPKDIDSVVNQLRFMITTWGKLAQGADQKTPKQSLVQALEYIRSHIQQETQPSKGTGSEAIVKSKTVSTRSRRATVKKRTARRKTAKTSKTAKKKRR